MTNFYLEKIECDFNAYALSSEPEDNCYYSFSKKDLHRLYDKAVVILYGYDSENEIVACEGVVERYEHKPDDPPIHYCGWRVRPIPGTWFHGPIPWNRS